MDFFDAVFSRGVNLAEVQCFRVRLLVPSPGFSASWLCELGK